MVALFLTLIFAMGSHAQFVPSLINYQGKLTDQSGNPLPAGIYGIQFRIWDSATATNGAVDLIWGQQQNATVQSNGVFNVILGSPGGSPIPGATPAVNNLTYAFAGSNRFLGVTIAISNGIAISSPNEIQPRQQFLSVPYTIQAQVAQSLVSNLSYALCPPGTVVAYMGTNAPPGWLLCDGSAVSRTLYANLFTVIGTASGMGDGSTTFNLPDMRGLFLRGVNGSRSDAFADPDDIALRANIFPGGNSGNAVGSYQADMFASHTHSFGVPNDQESSGSGPYSDGLFWHGGQRDSSPTGAAGGSETRPKNVYVNYIMKY